MGLRFTGEIQNNPACVTSKSFLLTVFLLSLSISFSRLLAVTSALLTCIEIHFAIFYSLVFFILTMMYFEQRA